MPEFININDFFQHQQIFRKKYTGRMAFFSRVRLNHGFDKIICLENLFLAWKEFIRGKRDKSDVMKFSFDLADNILKLHYDLKSGDYCHGGYESFMISDPKLRIIHKASVRDRLVHRAFYRKLYPFFDRTFSADSFSCRLEKGVHKALDHFRRFSFKASLNNTKTCWILKGDIKKFFASINHKILQEILAKYILDPKILNLLEKIINSFHSKPGIGLPLGNLTSQVLANIYLNEFDLFIKHRLKIKYYIRYADDFVVFSRDKSYLEFLIPLLSDFLKKELDLTLPQDRVSVRTLNSGVDFLGWVNFFNYRVLRTKTKRRMIKRVLNNPEKETVNSYLGLLKYGRTWKIKKYLGLTKIL